MRWIIELVRAIASMMSQLILSLAFARLRVENLRLYALLDTSPKTAAA